MGRAEGTGSPQCVKQRLWGRCKSSTERQYQAPLPGLILSIFNLQGEKRHRASRQFSLQIAMLPLRGQGSPLALVAFEQSNRTVHGVDD
ncbi:hypothetical protein NOLU111490_13300 [Novosphingobium lubricantis]